jgi:hypothetical protein
MRTCRFCAKDIHDAANACKHCGRTLISVPAVAPQKAETKTIWERILLVVGVLLAA